MNNLFYIRESDCEEEAITFFIDCICIIALLLTCLLFVLIEI